MNSFAFLNFINLYLLSDKRLISVFFGDFVSVGLSQSRAGLIYLFIGIITCVHY